MSNVLSGFVLSSSGHVPPLSELYSPTFHIDCLVVLPSPQIPVRNMAQVMAQRREVATKTKLTQKQSTETVQVMLYTSVGSLMIPCKFIPSC
jgi:hypothetical protein